ncbi:MAG: hypothetical protein CL908_18560 [Deltaproteobacteria bacterium]|jgi:hypothetical protein|nr:hypothetical protein [Deltaproteobacteria bacterium]
MRTPLSISTLIVIALFAGTTQAATVTTMVDTATRMVRLDLGELSAYEQIRLEGVMALSWCNCLDSDNPSSLMATGFTVNGSSLEMQYEEAPPPSTNYITYHYLDGYIFSGLESVDWIVVTSSDGGDDEIVTGNRPLFVPVPEPSTGLLCLFGLMVLSAGRNSARRAGVRANARIDHAP